RSADNSDKLDPIDVIPPRDFHASLLRSQTDRRSPSVSSARSLGDTTLGWCCLEQSPPQWPSV
ncbi:hypothetical protein Bpfe_023238, partial [Biomphalaria pfeifferi]